MATKDILTLPRYFIVYQRPKGTSIDMILTDMDYKVERNGVSELRLDAPPNFPCTNGVHHQRFQ